MTAINGLALKGMKNWYGALMHAELTELGVIQAKAAHMGWKRELELGAALPDLFILSPFTRVGDIAGYTWEGLTDTTQFIFKEQWRGSTGWNVGSLSLL